VALTQTRERTYEGICLGGPRDGQWISSPCNSYRVPVIEREDLRFGAGPGVPQTGMRVTYADYVWYNFGDYSVWWPVGGDDPNPRVIMKRLLDGYRKPVMVDQPC
jgi:hypothetical protein